MTRRWTRWIAIGVAFAVTTAACTHPAQTGPSTSTTAGGSVTGGDGVPKPPAPAAIAPVLRRPGPPGDAPAGVPTLLGGLVLAQVPIVRVELWNGSALVEATDYDEPETELRLGWNWVPPGPGLFGLVLRAVDAGGGVATSFPLWVRTVEPEVPQTAETSGPPGATASPEVITTGLDAAPPAAPEVSAAAAPPGVGFAAAGLPGITATEGSCEVSISLPAVQGAEGIAVYAASFGSAGFVPVGLLPPGGGETKLMVGAAPVMVYAEAFGSSKRNPGPPTIALPSDPCATQGWVGDLSFADGVLANPKGADRAYLYVSYDGGELWDRVPGGDQSFVPPGPAGGFDFGGMLHEVGAGATARFEAWGWVEGTLTPLGRGSWTGPAAPAPGAGGAGLGGNVSVAPYTGPLVADSDFDWLLGFTTDPTTLQPTDDPVLLRHGTICTYASQTPTTTTTTTVPVTVVGDTAAPPTTGAGTPGIGVLPDSCTNAPFGDYSTTFRWKPLGGGWTHGLLQVSTEPPPSDAAVSFPGLIYTQTVDKPAAAVDFVDLEVPLGDLIDPPAQSATLPDWEAMNFQLVLNLAGLGEAPGTNSYSFVPQEILSGAKSTTLYLRVIPMQETQSLLGESNSVIIDIEDTAPQPGPPAPVQPPAMSLEVRMTPPHLPNGKYERCVRVVENPFFFGSNPAPSQTPKWFQDRDQPVPAANSFDKFYGFAYQTAFVYQNGVKVNKGLVPGATVCAYQLDPPSKDAWDYIVDAVNFIGWVWDMYVTVWDMLKSWVADVIAFASGCVALAEAAGKSTEEAETFCSGLAKSAINYALIAYGVPPTMPKFQELVEMGKGEAKEWVIKLATDSGLDCSVLQAQCEEMAGKLLDELLDGMQVAATQAATQAAMSGSQWVLYIHPGIYVIPEPAGTMSPAVFEIEVTRSTAPGAPPPPPSCSYKGEVWGTKDQYEWMNYHTGTWQVGPVSGPVMKSGWVTLDLSDLQPGESTTGVLVLDSIAEFYPDGQHPQNPKTPWNVKPQTWIFFVAHTKNAVFTETNLVMQLNGGPSCGAAVQSHLQDNASTEPWEIPS